MAEELTAEVLGPGAVKAVGECPGCGLPVVTEIVQSWLELNVAIRITHQPPVEVGGGKRYGYQVVMPYFVVKGPGAGMGDGEVMGPALDRAFRELLRGTGCDRGLA